MHYLIGVDGGGTKTEAIAYSISGEVLAKCVSGYGNILMNKDKAMENIIKSISGCIEAVNNKYANGKCLFIFLGLAGVEVSNYAEYVQIKLKQYFNTNIKVVNDAFIAHASLLKGDDGILTISGTGSISIGKKGTQIERAGGWGHLLGDEGSGYYNSIQALKRAIYEEEMDYPKSLLTTKIMKKLNIEKVEQIKDFVYKSDKGEIAMLAIEVIDSCENDLNARNILIKAAKELSKITYTVARKLDLIKDVKIGIKGSILTNVDLVRKEFEKNLLKMVNGLSIINENVPSAKGGYYLALQELYKVTQ